MQFGFKPHSSTSLCIGVVKCCVSLHQNVGLLSMGVFLYYVSIEIDVVNHSVLFHKLLQHGLPFLIVHFLLSWL